MRRETLWRQEDFTGGMVDRVSPGPLQRNESELLENLELIELTRATKRKGFSKMNATPLAGAVQGIFEFEKLDGTFLLLVVAGGTVYKWNEGTTTFDQVATGLDSGATTRVTFVPWGDIIVLLNGVDAPQKYDTANDTVAPLGGSPPVAAFGEIYFNHLFLGGIPGEETWVYYSETADLEAGYGATNYKFEVVASDTSPVTGFLALDNELIVAKRRSIESVRGMDPRDFQKAQNRASYTNERGAVGPHAIIEVGGAPWFLSDDGVFALRGPFDTLEQSWTIDGRIRTINRGRIARAFAIRLGATDQVLFWVPIVGTDNSTALVAHPGRGRGGLAAWTIWTGLDVTTGAVGHKNQRETIYLGDAAGFIYEQGDHWLDNGTAVRSEWKSGRWVTGSPMQYKSLRSIVAEAEVLQPTVVQVGYVSDDMNSDEANLSFVGGGFILGVNQTGDMLGAGAIRRSRAQFAGRGFRHQIRLSHGENADLRLAAVEAKGHLYYRREYS